MTGKTNTKRKCKKKKKKKNYKLKRKRMIYKLKLRRKESAKKKSWLGSDFKLKNPIGVIIFTLSSTSPIFITSMIERIRS